MGGGRNFRDDVKRRGGEDLLKAASELNSGSKTVGGAGANGREFCAREHRLRFRVTDGLTPKAGEGITLLGGVPLQLVSDRGVVGVVESERTGAFNDCLGLDWKMSGTVMSVDAPTGRGVAIVTGEH